MQPAASSQALLTHVYGDDAGSAARLMQQRCKAQPCLPLAHTHSARVVPCHAQSTYDSRQRASLLAVSRRVSQTKSRHSCCSQPPVSVGPKGHCRAHPSQVEACTAVWTRSSRSNQAKLVPQTQPTPEIAGRSHGLHSRLKRAQRRVGGLTKLARGKLVKVQKMQARTASCIYICMNHGRDEHCALMQVS